jgi:hypothetical protein
MKSKIMIMITALTIAGAAISATVISTTHTHDESSIELDIRNGHSGRTDAYGGHNCSQKSINKGLCSGYHYH